MTHLADLDAMDRAALAALWTDLFRTRIPPKMSRLMQRRFLAFELQARAQGGLPPALLARLARAAEAPDRRPTPGLQPGARLIRAWCGTSHVVDVLADGYLWNGMRHRSLSAIARAITGARWSGPRFFGLLAVAGTTPVPETLKRRGGPDRPGSRPGGRHAPPSRPTTDPSPVA